MTRKNYTNEKYNDLTFVKPHLSGKIPGAPFKWEVKCECGQLIIVNPVMVKRGIIGNCGCKPTILKKCKTCKRTKSKNYFQNNQWNRTNSKCKDCTKICKKDYYNNNIEKIKKYKKEYYSNPENKKTQSICHKKRYADNKEYYKLYNQKYYQENKQKVKIKVLDYKFNNIEIIKEKRRNKQKRRRKDDPVYRLMVNVSRCVNRMLKSQKGSKHGKSISKFVPFTNVQLKEHIENLFEPWMNWDNQGFYIPKKWNDKDPLTWKWQLDHIIPQSELRYDSMSHLNFKKVWSLNNLRPYSAKQNILDGTNRTRHNKIK